MHAGSHLKFVDAVGLSLRVSGKSTQEASGALLQLSQLLSGNIVQAQEYNSLIDGAYPLLRAVAAGLKETGGDVGKLTALVKTGKVPTKAFFDAFLAGSDILQNQVASSELTVSQSFARMENVLIDVAGKVNDVTKVSEHLTTALNSTADAIHDFDVEGFIQKLANAETAAHSFLSELGNSSVIEKLNQLLGITDSKGNVIPIETREAQDKAKALEKQVETLQATIAKNTELGFDNTEALAQLGQVQAALAKVKGNLANMPASVSAQVLGKPEDLINAQVPFSPLEPIETGNKKQVTLADYPLTGSGKGKGGRSRRDSYAREVAQIKERTKAIEAETAAQASLDPLVDDYGYTVEKARAQQELLNAAQKAGKAITPELSAEIDKAADAYATATANSEKLARSQDRVRQSAEEAKQTARDFAGTFVDDLMDGKSATDALSDALKQLASRLESLALDQIFGTGNSSSGGAILGTIGTLHVCIH